MSDITLSNAVRTNLSSLQGTAQLLERTQERLSTGNKVNSALDNPVNFFTASGLTERSSDLSNLLDSISNSVQTLQAADEGITSIQKLVDSAKATARQALQAPKSFDSKANVSTVQFDGITADNLLANPIDTEAELAGLSSITDNTTLQAALTSAVAASEATAVIDTTGTAAANEYADLTAATEANVVFDYDAVDAVEAFDTGDTVSFTYTAADGTATTATYTFAAAADGSDGATFSDITSLENAINNDNNVNSLVSVSVAGSDITIAAAAGDIGGTVSQIAVSDAADTDESTTVSTTSSILNYTTNGGAADTLQIDLSNLAESLEEGDTITIAGNTYTYTSDTTLDTGASDGYFSNAQGLAGEINSDGPANVDTASTSFNNTNSTVTLTSTGTATTALAALTLAFVDNDSVQDTSGNYGTVNAADTSSSEITIRYGDDAVTYSLVSANSSNANNTFTSEADLVSRINEDFGTGTAVYNGTTTQIELTGASGDYTSTFTVGGDVTDTASVTITAPQEAVEADVLSVNGVEYTFVSGTADTTNNEFNTLTDLNTLLASQDIVASFDTSNSNIFTLTAATDELAVDIEVGGSAASSLFGTTTFADATASGSNGLTGQTLSVESDTGSVTVTFGTGAGQVDTLEELNDLINDIGLDASLDDDRLVFETTNDRGLDSILLSSSPAQENEVNISGTIIQTNGALDGRTVTDAVENDTEAESRADLVNDYNEILQQITDLAADASYNGINLLNGDDLKVIFNETNTSSLEIEGVVFDKEGLGLADIADADFLDADSINVVLGSLDDATTTLRSQASKFGSNLSVVETRQDFTSNLVDVLESGAANLTLADLNEEAANSAALSTRQQIATSALSLATQSDQGILQLLR